MSTITPITRLCVGHRLSEASVFNGIVHLGGMVPESGATDIRGQTTDVLAQVDAAFHLAIAEASHNLVLQQIIRGMFDLLAASTSQSLEKLYLVPRVSEALAEQHRLLMQAVLGGDPDRARAASDAHIDFVRLTLKAIDEDEARLARSNPPRSLLSGRTGGPDRKTDP